VIKPVVNINGTSGVELFEQWTKVHGSAKDLVDALIAATPHGRDFPDREQEYAAAMEQHRALVRCARVCEDAADHVRALIYDQIQEKGS